MAVAYWLRQSYQDNLLVYTYTNITDSTGKIITIREADPTNTYITTTNITYECH